MTVPGADSTVSVHMVWIESMIASAGAIAPLVDLVRVGGDAAKKEAAAALGELAFDGDVWARIAAAGGVAPLVALARGGSDGSKQWAGWALRNFAEVP